MRQGHEFGATTSRRNGWQDAVAVRRALQINSLFSFCITKLDVLDGLQEVKICTAYRLPDGRVVESIRWRLKTGKALSRFMRRCRAGSKAFSA